MVPGHLGRIYVTSSSLTPRMRCLIQMEHERFLVLAKSVKPLNNIISIIARQSALQFPGEFANVLNICHSRCHFLEENPSVTWTCVQPVGLCLYRRGESGNATKWLVDHICVTLIRRTRNATQLTQ